MGLGRTVADTNPDLICVRYGPWTDGSGHKSSFGLELTSQTIPVQPATSKSRLVTPRLARSMRNDITRTTPVAKQHEILEKIAHLDPNASAGIAKRTVYASGCLLRESRNEVYEHAYVKPSMMSYNTIEHNMQYDTSL